MYYLPKSSPDNSCKIMVIEALEQASWVWKKICYVKEKLLLGYTNNKWQGSTHDYTVAKGYKWLKPDVEKVQWRHFVSTTIAVPRVRFVCWLAVQGRLSTKDRLIRQMRFSICTDAVCVLCSNVMETHRNFFFIVHIAQHAWLCWGSVMVRIYHLARHCNGGYKLGGLNR